MTVSISTRTSGSAPPQTATGVETNAPAKAPAESAGSKGNTVESHPETAKPTGQAEAPKDLFASIFNIIGSLFQPQSKANGKPTFDLARVLSDILNAVGSVFGEAEKKSEAKPASAEKKEAEPKTEEEKKAHAETAKEEKAKALANQSMDKNGEVDSGDATIGKVKIGPGAGDGVRGLADAGQINVSGSADLGGGTTASGSVRGGTFAGGKVTSGVRTNEKGEVIAEVGVGAAVGARVGAQGQISGKWGSVSGYVNGEVQIYAKAEARARVGKDDAGAEAQVGVGALAGVDAGAKADLAGGLVKANASAEARSGAGADAKAGVTVKYNPPEAAFRASAGAFAGARAGFQAEGTIAGVGYNVAAEAWAGVGVKAAVDVGLKDGKFSFQLGVGVAVGVGVAFKVGFSMDTKSIGGIIKGVFGAAACVVGVVGQAVSGILKPVGDALAAITKPFGDIFGGLFKAIGGLFGGGKGDGSLAKDAVNAFSSLAETPKGLEGSLAGRDAEVARPRDSEKQEEKQEPAKAKAKPTPKPESTPEPEARPVHSPPAPAPTVTA
jgi:hypothetical protein